VNDIDRARARRRPPAAIRAEIREAGGFCPRCGVCLRVHTDDQIDRCAMALGDSNDSKENDR